jgi:hypothetical protein
VLWNPGVPVIGPVRRYKSPQLAGPISLAILEDVSWLSNMLRSIVMLQSYSTNSHTQQLLKPLVLLIWAITLSL